MFSLTPSIFCCHWLPAGPVPDFRLMVPFHYPSNWLDLQSPNPKISREDDGWHSSCFPSRSLAPLLCMWNVLIQVGLVRGQGVPRWQGPVP